MIPLFILRHIFYLFVLIPIVGTFWPHFSLPFPFVFFYRFAPGLCDYFLSGIPSVISTFPSLQPFLGTMSIRFLRDDDLSYMIVRLLLSFFSVFPFSGFPPSPPRHLLLTPEVILSRKVDSFLRICFPLTLCFDHTFRPHREHRVSICPRPRP